MDGMVMVAGMVDIMDGGDSRTWRRLKRLSDHKTKIITEIDLKDNCKHLRTFQLTLPSVTEKGFYRETMSFDYFFYGPNERNYKPSPKRREKLDFSDCRYVYHVQLKSEWDASTKRMRDFLKEQNRLEELYAYVDTLTVQHVTTLWDFYQEIGYDYKKQKWA